MNTDHLQLLGQGVEIGILLAIQWKVGHMSARVDLTEKRVEKLEGVYHAKSIKTAVGAV